MNKPLITTRIKVGKSKVTLGGFGPRKYQMYAWGKFAVETIKERVAEGKGSDDAPMPPLKGGYGRWKAKVGKGGRNLRLTGGMLDNFTVRYADERMVRADITSRLGRIKARANERRSPWFGFSRNDEKKIFTEATRIFGPNLRNIGVNLRANGLARRPIWLDPLGISGTAAKRAA